MKKTYVTPEMSVYALSTPRLLSGSNFDYTSTDSSSEDFVNPDGGGISPGEAL